MAAIQVRVRLIGRHGGVAVVGLDARSSVIGVDLIWRGNVLKVGIHLGTHQGDHRLKVSSLIAVEFTVVVVVVRLIAH